MEARTEPSTIFLEPIYQKVKIKKKEKKCIYKVLKLFKKIVDAPIFVFIHGGYWQEFHKDYAGFPITSLVSKGIKVIIAGYDLCPQGKKLKTKNLHHKN